MVAEESLILVIYEVLEGQWELRIACCSVRSPGSSKTWGSFTAGGDPGNCPRRPPTRGAGVGIPS